MGEAIRFYFDFASPYAYFALNGIAQAAARYERAVEWRPILAWAVFKAHGIAPPMDIPAKHAYFVIDMARSAAFHGVDYRHPLKLTLSSHLCARLYYAIAEQDPSQAQAFGREVFAAFFARGEDISDVETVVRLAGLHGVGRPAAEEGLNGARGRSLLAAAVEAAIGDRVCGSPFFIIDGEPFFGADRLPQISWRLQQIAQSRGPLPSQDGDRRQ
jgi:2-hydroxychromene-2-carboxylate isomerase